MISPLPPTCLPVSSGCSECCGAHLSPSSLHREVVSRTTLDSLPSHLPPLVSHLSGCSECSGRMISHLSPLLPHLFPTTLWIFAFLSRPSTLWMVWVLCSAWFCTYLPFFSYTRFSARVIPHLFPTCLPVRPGCSECWFDCWRGFSFLPVQKLLATLFTCRSHFWGGSICRCNFWKLPPLASPRLLVRTIRTYFSFIVQHGKQGHACG